MPKLFFCDIDGTLLRSDGTISESMRKALQDLAAAGHGMILTSGRPLSGIMHVYDYLDIPFTYSYIIANNGCLVYDCNAGQPIYEKRLPLSLIDRIRQLAGQMGVHIQTYTDDAIVCQKDNPELRSYNSRIRMPVIYADTFSDVLTKPPYKMLSLSLSGTQKLLPFRAEVERQFGDNVTTMFSGSGYLEIIARDADKGKALEFLCMHTGIPISQSYAAGDCENDIPMLLSAGKGFAMQNAEEIVRQKAPLCTKYDNDHDGIAEIIKDMLA